jgi:hypothetical protein
MPHSDQAQSEPQVFVLKQGPQESDTAFEARIGAITQEISESAQHGPVILYSVAKPADVPHIPGLNS